MPQQFGGGGLREKKKRKACWPEEKSCWRCSYWYREDQCVVVGHNSGGDAVVIIAQRRPVEVKKKIREKLIFSKFWPLVSPPSIPGIHPYL
jgi:hypothetical protein